MVARRASAPSRHRHGRPRDRRRRRARPARPQRGPRHGTGVRRRRRDGLRGPPRARHLAEHAALVLARRGRRRARGPAAGDAGAARRRVDHHALPARGPRARRRELDPGPQRGGAARHRCRGAARQPARTAVARAHAEAAQQHRRLAPGRPSHHRLGGAAARVRSAVRLGRRVVRLVGRQHHPGHHLERPARPGRPGPVHRGWDARRGIREHGAAGGRATAAADPTQPPAVRVAGAGHGRQRGLPALPRRAGHRHVRWPRLPPAHDRAHLRRLRARGLRPADRRHDPHPDGRRVGRPQGHPGTRPRPGPRRPVPDDHRRRGLRPLPDAPLRRGLRVHPAAPARLGLRGLAGRGGPAGHGRRRS